uniref:Uncharacterized protein n=1 Tax=Caenorhabditis japonica TaxID=281687 RepID=A0A8R1DV26_CAEJA
MAHKALFESQERKSSFDQILLWQKDSGNPGKHGKNVQVHAVIRLLTILFLLQLERRHLFSLSIFSFLSIEHYQCRMAVSQEFVVFGSSRI